MTLYQDDSLLSNPSTRISRVVTVLLFYPGGGIKRKPPALPPPSSPPPPETLPEGNSTATYSIVTEVTDNIQLANYSTSAIAIVAEVTGKNIQLHAYLS